VTIVAVCATGGTTGSTTSALMLAAMMPAGYPTLLAECDLSGGDVAAWAQLPAAPGWSTAVAGGDRSWSAIVDNAQHLPSGLRVLPAPARASAARTAVSEGARGFAGLLAAMPDVVAVADCGRFELDPPLWATSAQLTLLLVRQAVVSAEATVPRVDRAIEALSVLRGACRQVGVVLVGGAPYRASEIATALGAELFGVLPEDAAGAALACGGWTVGKRASRTPLARAAGELGQRVVEALYGRGHRPEQLWSAQAVAREMHQ
jgi:hypothetical protein